MDSTTQALIASIHDSGVRCVLALTGGGSAALAQLLSVAGASRSILEAIIPYHSQALVEFLGHPVTQYCSADTARELARRALDRAQWLAPADKTLGLGATATLASDRPKRGEHRVFVSIAHKNTLRTWSLVLSKGARDRLGEETVAAAFLLHALGKFLALAPRLTVPLLPDDSLEELPETPGLVSRSEAGAIYLAEDGQIRPGVQWRTEAPTVLVPGSFNPLHAGHWRLAEAAALLTSLPFAFEISRANVDKPDLSDEETRRRLEQFAGRAPLWLTRAPRFVDKARLFPGALFALGADTAARLVDARYYDGAQAMLDALAAIAQLGCRFLVADRRLSGDAYLRLADLCIPEEHRHLFAAIPEEACRVDISSTALRSRCTIR